MLTWPLPYVTFGNFQFTNMDFYGNLRRKSLMYLSATSGSNVNMLPIRFCAGPDDSANCDPFPPTATKLLN